MNAITTATLNAQRETLAGICREINETVKALQTVDVKVWKKLDAKRIAMIQTMAIGVPIDEVEALRYFENSLSEALSSRRALMLKTLADLTGEAEKGGYRLANALEWKTEALMEVATELSLFEYAASLWDSADHTYAGAQAVVARFQERMTELLWEKGRNLNNSTSPSTNLMAAQMVGATAKFLGRGSGLYLKSSIDTDPELFLRVSDLFNAKIAEASAFLVTAYNATSKLA